MQNISFSLFKNTEYIPIFLMIILIFCTFFIYKKDNNTIAKKELNNHPLKKSKIIPKLSKKDIINIIIITLIYAIISLWKLGSLSFPNTTWQPSSPNQFITLELTNDTKFTNIMLIYGEGDNNSNPDSFQIGVNEVIIRGSNDSENWKEITRLTDGSIYQYINIERDNDYKYIQLESTNKNNTITEIGFYNSDNNKYLDLSIKEDEYDNSKYPASLIIDEQDKLAINPNYENESYFDEIYHVRNAYEVANGQYMYYSVHPLLGTNIIALFIKLFGLSPFIWRLPGAIFGILMIPIFYLLIHALLTTTSISTLATIIFTFDFMHITTSRIATLEPFSIFFIILMFYFMLRYYYTSFFDTPLKVQFKYLFLSGLFMGIGIATKWTACYGAVGLAILLFINLYERYKEYKYFKKNPQEYPEGMTDIFYKNTFLTILVCFIFFIFIPIIIYLLSFVVDHIYREPYSIMNIWRHNKYMYEYHATLKATHPFESTWYQWLLDVRPMWYYFKNGNDYANTIACFSHPLLCWTGLIAICFNIYYAFIKKDKEAFFITIGILSNLLPWVIIDRCVFSYHFYPTSIFIVSAIALLVDRLKLHEGNDRKYLYIFTIIYLIIFIIYMPILTGFNTSLDYIHLLEIFRSWSFG